MATVEERQSLIVDHPPRIVADYSDEVLKASQRHTARLRTTGSSGAVSPDPSTIAVSDIPEMIVTLMGCHPELYEKVADVSVMLMAKSTLPRRELELVVLRTDWLCQSPYNWGEHVSIAKRFGVTSEEIERITQGSVVDGWSHHDRALVRAAEELHEDSMLSDETWDILRESFTEKQIFELIVLIGQFTLVTYFQNSLRFRLGEGNLGLQSR